MRKAEARRLLLRHLDVEQGRLGIIEGKGRKDRLIPLPPELVDEILMLAVSESLGPRRPPLVRDQGQPVR
ncbi:MAG: hypothetical protein ACRDNG_14565 [Gaiellaceae bacterium]